MKEVKYPWWNKISKGRADKKELEKIMEKMMLQCRVGDDTDYILYKG